MAALTLLLLICAVSVSHCYPVGAPASACSELLPGHTPNAPQTSDGPYTLSLAALQVSSSLVYSPEQQYEITLTSKNGSTPFKGFLIQAMSLYDSSKVYGMFINLSGNTQYLVCPDIDSLPYQGVVTHSNPLKMDFYSISFSWTAPSSGAGVLVFKFTVVQSYSVYWAKQSSAVVQEATDAYLLYANQWFIGALYTNGSGAHAVLSNLDNAGGSDYHYGKNYMFWTNGQLSVGAETIKRSYLDGSSQSTIVDTNLITPSSIAVDWINDKLYWSDENTSRIEVAELSGNHRRTLIETNLLYPRGLIADPSSRYIFWVDWGRDVIERASMDGTGRTVVVSEGLNNPLSITLDHSTQTLYWIDVPGMLESSSYNGSNRQTLFVSQTLLFNTVGMAYYSNTLFWTERQDNGIYSAPINELGSAQVLVNGLSYEPYQLHVVHSSAQPAASNPCTTDNGGCGQLCLLSASSPSGYSCACADGFLPTDSSSAQCTGAPIYKAQFCMSSVPAVGCSSWTVADMDKKLFQVGEVMVTSVEEICQCGLTSSSLTSSSNSSFTCHPDDPTVVLYQGFVYGISQTDNTKFVDSFHEWASSNAPVQIYGDTLYIGCTISSTSSAIMTPVASSLPSPVDPSGGANVDIIVVSVLAAVGVITLPVSVCCCIGFAYYSWRLGLRRQKQNVVIPYPDEPPPSYACVQASVSPTGMNVTLMDYLQEEEKQEKDPNLFLSQEQS